MLQRRQLGSLLLAAAASCTLPTAASAAPSRHALFRIARSKNKNVVLYTARCRGNDLDSAGPIEAHWLMLAEDGRREELSWAERELAYGFSVSELAGEGCKLRLAACKARTIQVQRRPEGFRALITIAGRRALLERIFVQASEGALLPSVEFVELVGARLDGSRISERLVAR